MKIFLDDNFRREIGKIFETLKKEKKLSDKKIATYCGVDTQTILRWRGGKHVPEEANFERLKALAGGSLPQTSSRGGQSEGESDMEMVKKLVELQGKLIDEQSKRLDEQGRRLDEQGERIGRLEGRSFEVDLGKDKPDQREGTG